MTGFFCPLPWIHQFVEADTVKFCCASTKQMPMTPVEFQHSDYLKGVKDTIRSGEAPIECSDCVWQELHGHQSTRTRALRDFPHYNIDNIPDKVEYLDLRHSNLCNFSCRMCAPVFSTRIGQEIKSNPELRDFYPEKPYSPPINANIGPLIEDMLPNLTRINLTGGEPLLIKENIALLQKLIDMNMTNKVHLLITTNGSHSNPAITSLVGAFGRVHWTVSIDAVEDELEYIRHGAKWDLLEKNIDNMLDSVALGYDSHSLTFNVTLSAYSVLGIDKLAKWYKRVNDRMWDDPVDMMFNVVYAPDFLSPAALPGHLHTKAIFALDEAYRILSKIEKESENLIAVTSMFTGYDDPVLTPKFLEFTKITDRIRKQDFASAFGITL